MMLVRFGMQIEIRLAAIGAATRLAEGRTIEDGAGGTETGTGPLTGARTGYRDRHGPSTAPFCVPSEPVSSSKSPVLFRLVGSDGEQPPFPSSQQLKHVCVVVQQ